MKTRIATIALIALFAAPMGLSQTGGGDVSNIAPTVSTSLAGDQGTVGNTDPVVEVFTFSVTDQNGEGDVEGVKIVSTDATFGTQECLDVDVSTSCSNWAFVDATPDDGIWSVTYTHTWPAEQTAGTFTQTAYVKDETAYVSDAGFDQTIFQAEATLTIDAGVFDASGVGVGGNFGGWAAAPGATDVASVNYKHVTNTGTADGSATLSFTSAELTGATHGETIAIDGNIKFSTGTGANPSAGMTLGSVDADGSITVTVPANGEIWIGYEIVAFPTTLADDSYSAAFTLTDTS